MFTFLTMGKIVKQAGHSNISEQLVLIGLVGRVLPNGPGDRGSIPGRVIPKTKNGTWYLLA